MHLLFLPGNHALLMCVMSFFIYSAHGQNRHRNINSLIIFDEPVDDIQKPVSQFGSRIHHNLKNQGFSARFTERGRPMSENYRRYGMLGNNIRPDSFKRNQENSYKSAFTWTSNGKQVGRIHKNKSLHNIPNNFSNTLHRINDTKRNPGFSRGNNVQVNTQSNEYSRMYNYRNDFKIPKELNNNQDLSNVKRVPTTSYKFSGAKKGFTELTGSNSLSPANRNSTIKTSAPCSCFWSKEKCGCSCNDSLIYDDFQELSKSFQPCSNFSFAITGGQHFSLPPNLFTQIGQAQNIHIKITNATFDYLFDATPYTSAFRGVSFDKTALIELLGVRVRRGWNWTPLEYLNSSSGAGVEIKLEGCGLRRLSSDFDKVANGRVSTASISDSRLEMIGSGAFASFNDMTHFMLPRNRLRSIKRTDLPKEPLDLVEIDLRDNQLQSLEADLFTEMPSLQIISLAGNPLRVLPEVTFSNIIGRATVPGLSDFPLQCDCRLRWLKNSSFTRNEVVLDNLKGMVCKRPPHLRGTPFKDLSKEHLMC